jgi:hypothetical protein
VQAAIRLVFERYSVEPSAYAVARWAQRHGVQIPVRRNCVGGRELVWSEATARRVVEIIRNPVYAGVYVYGRRHNKKVIVDGEIRYKQMQGRDPEQWPVRIDGTHVSYISWEQYLKNQQKLRNNLCRSVTQGAPRDGDALLSGLLLCGQCGYRVGTTYSNDGLHYYRCYGEPPVRRACTMLPGRAIDRAVEQLFLNTMVPQELELSLAVEREVDAKAQSLDRHWTLRVERAEYEARHAERRYKAVDPDNRVVARTLEGEWERCLSELEQVRTDYERAKREQRVELTELDRERIRALARDLPNVWRSPTTRQADRKAMLRLVIEAHHPRVDQHAGSGAHASSRACGRQRTRSANRRTPRCRGFHHRYGQAMESEHRSKHAQPPSDPSHRALDSARHAAARSARGRLLLGPRRGAALRRGQGRDSSLDRQGRCESLAPVQQDRGPGRNLASCRRGD